MAGVISIDSATGDLLERCRAAMAAADAVAAAAQAAVASRVGDGAAALDAHQHAAHGLAWIATTVEALRALLGWAAERAAAEALGERESLMLQAGFGEYL